MTIYLPPSLRGFVPKRVVQSMWTDHMSFAYDLVGATWPRVIVELGTQYGLSYFALCQSVDEHEHRTRCYAVDTWEGDEHSGVVEVEISEGRRGSGQVRAESDPYASVSEYNERYAHFSSLLRMTFDEALPRFADQSISILHIDGCHTYESVEADFEKWYPKVEPGGIILMHDTNARLRDYGVWRFWSEVRERMPSFEFKHCYGLGVLEKPGGQASRPPLLSLLFSGDEQTERDLRAFYAHAAKFQMLSKRRHAVKRLRERVRRKKLANRPPRKPGERAELPGRPWLSIVVPLSESALASDRCLYSLSATYQSEVQEGRYEVLALEGTEPTLGEEKAIAWSANVRYIPYEDVSEPSPRTLAQSIEKCRGSCIGLLADSLRILSPSTIKQVFAAAKVFPDATIVVPPYQLSRRERGRPPVPYTTSDEVTAALEELEWKLDGERFFDVARVSSEMPRGLLGPLSAPGALFVPRRVLESCSSFARQQDMTAAIAALYREIVTEHGSTIVLLAGEGAFHQAPSERTSNPASQMTQVEFVLFGTIAGRAHGFLRDAADAALEGREAPVIAQQPPQKGPQDGR